ncbi:MAG: amidohydrolase family protein [Gammaproteobacteria bacterium]
MQDRLSSMPVIDIDTHWAEAPDTWTARAPARLREVAPRIERNAQGIDQWVVDRDIVLSPVGFCVVKRDSSKLYGRMAVDTYQEMHPGAGVPEERLKVMDGFGLSAQILYPNTLGFAGSWVMKIEDRRLRDFCISGYNDCMAEVQARGNGRLFPQIVVPFWDIGAAVAEIQRCHDRFGMTGVVLTDAPENWGLPSFTQPHWDPLWSTVQERNLPVNFHIGGGFNAGEPWQGLHGPGGLATASVTSCLGNIRAMTNLIFSGLLDRYPALKFVSVESGIGWVPFLIEFCEYQYDESAVTHLKLRPTDYFRRNIYASYWFESDAAGVIARLGADNIMFETDYPHPTCLYPGVREKIRQTLGGLAEDVQRKVLYENAARVYGITASH